MKKLAILALCLSFGLPELFAQAGDWQQAARYTIDVDMDGTSNRYSGKETIQYTNYSPDTLSKVFFHLFYNAFQPGSMMDVRSRTIMDPDSRVGDRISLLGPDEIGELKVENLKVDGKDASILHEGTILEVTLAQPIMPGQTVSMTMDFQGQVPLQIRRSGRDNAEGIRYSMSQWYPKLCEYDYDGWHANPYVGREFHGVWGDFDVTIGIDADYTVAATGVLQDMSEFKAYGYGLEAGSSPTGPVRAEGKKKWNFKASQVHDFVWAADPDYTHSTIQVENGPLLHFFYQSDSLQDNWNQLPGYTAKAFAYMNKRFGKYPYPSYSVIQGGDGGMEYPMATLITGKRSLSSLVGVTVHELIHSWYQGVLASNEALFPWIDEGFTSYATHETMAQLFDYPEGHEPHKGSYQGYFALVKSGLQEPMRVHADHYQTNFAYGVNAYSKGTITLHQLSGVIGQAAFDRGMKRYFEEFKFRHPDVRDFKHVMEKTSGLELDWYFEYWVNTTHTIDYAIDSVYSSDRKSTTIRLERFGQMPMPQEVLVETKDGTQTLYYIPLRIMRGEKPQENMDWNRVVLQDWPWTNPEYSFDIPVKTKQIVKIRLNPSGKTADVNWENDRWPAPEE